MSKDKTLVELPCKIGDKVWYIVARGEYSTVEETTVRAILLKEKEYEIFLHNTARVLTNNPKRNSFVYLIKAEAEAKLKEFKEH